MPKKTLNKVKALVVFLMNQGEQPEYYELNDIHEEVNEMKSKSGKGKMSVQEAGRKGGQTTSKKHGRKFYHEIGTKGGQRVKELIQNAKKAESKKND